LQSIAAFGHGSACRLAARDAMVRIMQVLRLNPIQVVDPIVMAPHCCRRIIGFEGRAHSVTHMLAIDIMRKKWSSLKASSG
jgi:hypothetical protein